MAWPVSPLTTYIAGLPPAIKAFDLNAIQTAINNILNGALTIKAVALNLGPGFPAFPPPGTLVTVGTVASTTFPNTDQRSFDRVVGVGTVPLGWVVVDSVGNLVQGTNVKSGPGVVRTGAGTYEIEFYATPATANACTLVTPLSFGATYKAVPSFSGPRLKVTVTTYNPATGAATDCGFSLLVFGE